MSDVLLSVNNLVKHFGGLMATDHLNLEVRAGEVHALIGPNGAGKTTVMGQLTGELRPDSGHIVFNERDVTRWSVQRRALGGMARSYQITELIEDFSVLENVMLMVQANNGHSFRGWAPIFRQASLVNPALQAIEEVGLTRWANDNVAMLAYGQQRQVELAMALAMSPRLLLLDEPLAGMGSVESAGMIDLLKKLKQQYTILLVEHDMQAVFALADRISVLVSGRTVATGSPDEVRNDPAVRKAYLGDDMSPLGDVA